MEKQLKKIENTLNTLLNIKRYVFENVYISRMMMSSIVDDDKESILLAKKEIEKVNQRFLKKRVTSKTTTLDSIVDDLEDLTIMLIDQTRDSVLAAESFKFIVTGNLERLINKSEIKKLKEHTEKSFDSKTSKTSGVSNLLENIENKIAACIKLEQNIFLNLYISKNLAAKILTQNSAKFLADKYEDDGYKQGKADIEDVIKRFKNRERIKANSKLENLINDLNDLITMAIDHGDDVNRAVAVAKTMVARDLQRHMNGKAIKKIEVTSSAKATEIIKKVTDDVTSPLKRI